MIKIDESDKVEDASLYSEASNEGGDGEGERAGLPGEDLVKLVHWRGWGDSQRGMVAMVAAEVVPRTWPRVCIGSRYTFLDAGEVTGPWAAVFHSFYNVRN